MERRKVMTGGGGSAKDTGHGLDEQTRARLLRYLRDVPALPNEAAKTHRFAGLVSELFPGTSAPTELAQGIEKLVRIKSPAGDRRGRIDTYHGNAVIEFENSLRATQTVAEGQLRGYVAGLWARRSESAAPLVCIASDGINWIVYHPGLHDSARRPPCADDVALQPLRELVLREETLHEFWLWLTSVLFRKGRIEPSAERLRVEFGATSAAFADAATVLRSAWEAVKGRPEADVAFEAWKKYLTLTYGALDEKGLASLFLKHTYLACVARLLVWASLSGGRTDRPLREAAGDVLSGSYFRSLGIQNLAEDDFFQWVRRREAERTLAPVWERILAQIQDYDLGLLKQDVLKELYQELVDPKDRHDLGEYYTPDWLCERIVAELLPADGFPRVLDPTCGSGSFLRAAVVHLLARNAEGGEATRLRAILDAVVGIDVHPLAVIIARATYALALGRLLKATKRPVQIPVYLADSLFLPAEVQQYALGAAPSYEIRFGGDKRVQIPEGLVKDPDLFDPAVAICADVAADHAGKGKESPRTLEAYVRKAVPRMLERRHSAAMLVALWEFTEGLSDLIRRQRNSIWAFVVRNAYRPAMLREHFDFIVGNPPWLSYRYIADPEYQAEVKRRAVDEYGIAPRKQKLMTHMELATVFLVHALTTFGREGARLGFVMPRSVLNADQHENLRRRAYSAPVAVDRYWDLRQVRPLFNVPACVVFATKKDPRAATSYRLPVTRYEGRLPGRDLGRDRADPHIHVREETAQVIYLGSRSAFSTRPGRTVPNAPSAYAARFHQGATIVPRSFYFVRIKDIGDSIDPERLYWVETDPEQAKAAKKPYNDVRLSGHVEGEFLYSTALSRHVLPFALLAPAPIVLPVSEGRQRLKVQTAAELRASGFREAGRWMAECERIWDKKRSLKAERQTIYERLDYQGELTSQDLGDRFLVLYNASGTNMAAAAADRRSLRLPFVVDAKLYWCACGSRDEADYLTAILNASCVNEEIKPFQSVGLMGERDIHKKALELPIPQFQPGHSIHLSLARLGREAATAASLRIVGELLPRGLAARRAVVREAIAPILQRIDEGVAGLLAEP